MEMQEIWERYHQFIGFVVAIIVCLAINLIALTCTNHAYKDGQQRILQSYTESLSLIDSLQKQNEDALNRALTEREKTIKKILSDTLIDNIQGLCTKQKDAVRKYVRPYLEVTTRELDIKDKIKADPNQEYKVLRDEIRSLLQLEFNKLQNEYESIEVWAAILTVIFLIFSFYSLFKTERLEEKGYQSISKIEELESNAHNNLEDLQNSMREENQAFLNQATDRFEGIYNDQTSRIRNMEENMRERFQSYQSQMEEMLNEARNLRNGQFNADNITTDVSE